MGKQNNMGTYTLSPTGGPNNDGVYVINDTDGVSIIALKLSTGGAATIQGAAKIGSFGVSSPVALLADEPTMLSNPDFIDGLTITVTSGTVLCLTNQ